MNIRALTAFCFIVAPALAMAAEEGSIATALTPPSGLDYRFVGHMPNYEAGPPPPPPKPLYDLQRYTILTGPRTLEQKQAMMATFRIRRSDIGGPDVMAEGEKHAVLYRPRPGTPPSSASEIHRNYRAAFKTLGADVVYADAVNTVVLLEDGRRQIWIKVEGDGTEYLLTAVEEREYRDLRPLPSRAEMKAALDHDGHVPVYLDFARHGAKLGPEAGKVMADIAALLRDERSLTLIVAGYTDAVGDADENERLSAERAKAVVAALVAQGVSPARLKPVGYGADSPVGDNDRSSGRAQNRRIELIKEE